MNKAESGKRKAEEIGEIYHCIVGAVVGLPGEIQYLPPGTHSIVAWKVGRDGTKKPAELTVTIDAGVADRLQRSLDGMLGEGTEPYFDFVHREEEASGWLKSFHWAGSDPDSGGVRAAVDWTASGRAALEGKDLTKFSAAFTVDGSGQIDGTLPVAGGLVNRPAFREIKKIVAADAGTQNGRNQMAETDNAQALAAQEAENAELKQKIAAMEAQLAEQAKNNARSRVMAAAADGRLPAKAADLHEKWIAGICAYPGTAELLDGLPKREVPGRIIQASAADRGDGGLMAASGDDLAARQKAAVAQIQAQSGCDFPTGWRLAKDQHPELWRAGASGE